MKYKYFSLTLVLILCSCLNLLAQIAEGQDKWLGNVYGSGQLTDFTQYWNQVTPENAGKWGSVEGTRDQMNWSSLDGAYKLAKDNGFPFRFHVLIWGNQQPGWIENLSPEEQLEEIEEWFAAVAERYPDIDYLEVVNEPINDPPRKRNDGDTGSGNYIEALGGEGETGWDWILTSFRLARQYFPNTTLMINEYNIIGSTTNVGRYCNIIQLLQAEELIDAIGIQGHAFSTKNAHVSTLTNNLNYLADTGLPMYVTELDIDGPTDIVQLKEYQRVFPRIWEYPVVQGVTLWGWKHGMWRTAEGAYLVNRDRTERPAMTWLRAYVRDELVTASSVEVQADAETLEVGSAMQMQAAISPDEATLEVVEWSVEPEAGSGGQATISENGILTGVSAGTVIVRASALDGSGVSDDMHIEITNLTAIRQERADSFVIYPNPVTNGSFTLRGDERITAMKVLDLSGNQVQHLDVKELPVGGSIDVELNVAPGLYFIQLTDGQNSSFKRIIVQ